jgi:putative DNA primase/helicase
MTDDPAKAIADMVDGDTPSPPAPQPRGEGPPEEEFGEDIPEGDRPADWMRLDQDVIVVCSREPQNDTGNGKRLLNHFGADLLHVREIGWHAWAGTHWRREGGDEAVVRAAQSTAARSALEADYIAATPFEAKAIEAAEDAAIALDELRKSKKQLGVADKKQAARLQAVIDAGGEASANLKKRQVNRRKFAVSSGNASRIAGMIAQALPHRTVPPDALDADPLKFNCENGTILFEQYPDPDCPDPDVVRLRWRAVLRPHDRADKISKLAPVAYDPEAKCPRFLTFIDMVQPVEDKRRFLQDYHGYATTGLTGEQCLVLNTGLGANGKSTFIEIIARVMGDYALTLNFETVAGESGRRGDQATPDIARLPGARLVRASEPERGVHFKESLIKSLTGGEPMLARHLHKGFFEFRPIFKLSLSANQKPEIGGVDHGIWRRMRLVLWSVTIENPRPFEDVIADFWEERAGILNWLVEGALRYLNEGLIAPPSVTEATADYREDMDPVGSFCADCVERLAPIEGQEPPNVAAREMFTAFVAWCEANAVRPWKEKSFATAMASKGYVRHRTGQVRRYLGVRLHDVPARKERREEPPPHPGDEEVPL